MGKVTKLHVVGSSVKRLKLEVVVQQTFNMIISNYKCFRMPVQKKVTKCGTLHLRFFATVALEGVVLQ